MDNIPSEQKDNLDNPNEDNTTEQKADENKAANSEKPYDLEPNVEASLAYLLGPITGVIVFILEKENKFVRFHALQSILFGIAGYVIWQITQFTMLILIGFILVPVVSVVLFSIWLILMWKAYNNEEWEVPYLGKIAHDYVNK